MLISFTRIAALMVVPWRVVITVEYVVFRRMFAADRATVAEVPTTPRSARPPWYAVAVLTATLAGFAAAEPAGAHPAWVAAAGALALAVPHLRRAPLVEAGRLERVANLPFCAFVFGVSVIVLAVRSGLVGGAVDRLVQHGSGLPGMLGAALLAATLANLVNNLPATLMLVPVVAHSPALVLAVLVGTPGVGPGVGPGVRHRSVSISVPSC